MAKKPAAKIPGLRFSMTNPSAEKKINKTVGRMITRLRNDAKVVVREAILDGYKKGKAPGSIALDLAGRINPSSGKREGGLIGMSSPQAEATRNFREKLETGDLKGAMDYKLRDKRFDGTLEKAIAKGKETGELPSLAADKIERMVDRYTDAALELRGETIARTETGAAVGASSLESFEQALEKTEFSKQSVTRIWRTAGDDKVRDSHESMDGQTVEGVDEPFVSGDGAEMMAPLDSSLGADAGDIINCRCDVEISIDFTEGVE